MSEGHGEQEPNPPHILVVDDDPVVCKALSHQLRRLGVAVEAVENGEACLSACARQVFRVVFLDFRLPDLTGPEVAEKLRASGFRHALIGLTAEENARDRCLAAGMNECISKPVNSAGLLEVLQAHLPDPLDRARALAERSGKPELVPRLTATFLHSTHELFEELNDASDEASLSLLHRLKGSAATFGAHQLGQMARLAETQIRTSGKASAGHQLSALRELWGYMNPKLEFASRAEDFLS